MGNTLRKLFEKKEMEALMVGLSGAGKTSILYQMKLNKMITTHPTLGFNVEKVEYKNCLITVWDVGGQKRIRNLWQSFVNQQQALIFVVSAVDLERIDDAAQEFKRMLEDPKLVDAPLLILLNKCDLQRKITTEQIIQIFNLNNLDNRRCLVQECSALNGDGLYEGFDWLSRELKKL